MSVRSSVFGDGAGHRPEGDAGLVQPLQNRFEGLATGIVVELPDPIDASGKGRFAAQSGVDRQPRTQAEQVQALEALAVLVQRAAGRVGIQTAAQGAQGQRTTVLAAQLGHYGLVTHALNQQGGAVEQRLGAGEALGAVGVTLIFGILRFAHFSHGDMMTASAFFALLLAGLLASFGISLPIPLVLALLPVVMALTAVFAIGLDRAFYRPLRQRGAKPVVMVMASIGVTLMLQGLIRLFAGTGSRDMYLDAPKTIFRIPTGGRPIVLTEPQVALIALTVISVIALHLFLTRSRLGKAMRAVSDNPDLARVTGIPIERVVKATWAIGGGLAAIAGTMLAMDVQLKPDLAYNILLPIFAATIVGGIGQPYGAIAGGYLIGFAETLAVFNFSVLLRPFRDLLPAGFEIPASLAMVPTEYRLVVPFFILVAVLIYRPTGIFKGRVF